MAVSVGWRAGKWLIRHADDIAPPAYLAIKYLLDHDAEAGTPGWHRIVVRFSRKSPAGFPEDYAQFKLDLVKIADGASDNAWAPADFTAIATALDAWHGGMSGSMANTHTLVEYRAYRMRFNQDDPGPAGAPAIPAKPFQDTGGPVWVLPKALIGGSSSIYPYQVAVTATFRTGFPKHWGRIYVPGWGRPLDANARIALTDRQQLANAMFDLEDAFNAAGMLLCVPMSQMGKQRFHGLLGVREIVVDDIPDVIRRRRPKLAAGRAIGVE